MPPPGPFLRSWDWKDLQRQQIAGSSGGDLVLEFVLYGTQVYCRVHRDTSGNAGSGWGGKSAQQDEQEVLDLGIFVKHKIGRLDKSESKPSQHCLQKVFVLILI